MGFKEYIREKTQAVQDEPNKEEPTPIEEQQTAEEPVIVEKTETIEPTTEEVQPSEPLTESIEEESNVAEDSEEESSGEDNDGSLNQKLDEVAVSIAILEEKLDKIGELQSQNVLKKDLIDSLSMSISKASDETRRDAIRNILKDVANTIELYRKFIADMRKDYAHVPEASKIMDDFETFSIHLENILYLRDVDIFEQEDFDKTRVKVISVKETSDKELDMKIAEVKSRGYALGDQVLVPQGVILYKFNEQTKND